MSMIVAQMSAATECNCACPSPVVSPVPGTAGGNSYSTISANFVVPANNTQVAVTVVDSEWMVAGQIVITDGPAHFEVFSANGTAVVLIFRAQTGDVSPGATVSAGAAIAPSGHQGTAIDDPLLILNGGTSATTAAGAVTNLFAGAPLAVTQGGTGAITKALAQTALGLGQDPLISTVTGLAQAVTASAVQVAGSDVTMPAAGNWLVSGNVAITITGATFAASRTVTVKVRNTTQGVDVVTTTFQTGIITTATSADQIVVIPPVNYSGGSVNDHLQVFVSISVINSAGTYAVASATLCAVPLRKS